MLRGEPRAAPATADRQQAAPVTTRAASSVRRAPQIGVQRELVQSAEFVAGPAPFAAVASSSRIRPMDRPEALDQVVPTAVADTSRIVRREPVDNRAESWKAADKAANDKRMAHARDQYLFDKSLQADDASSSATGERMADQRAEVTGKNDVGELSDAFVLLYNENPEAAIEQAGFSANQAATAHARMKAKGTIPKPADLLPPDKIAKHLGKFAKGAHAFIDPSASKKIEGEITDTRFKGWGIDANFVAPLDEANALNSKAHKEHGIETIEDELGIPGKYWSKTAWNPEKELVRWVIPKPKLAVDGKDAGVLLEMATGQESGADSKLWVAGGLTKGGASEAVMKAIPREQLVKHLAEGEIRQKIETYPETRDGIQ